MSASVYAYISLSTVPMPIGLGRRGRDCYRELPRIPILGTSVYRATQAQWRCPDSRMAAFLFLSFGAGSGCNHSEAWAGCIVSLTTPTRWSLNASRSVSLRNLAEKSSRVFLASYLLR